MFVEAVFKGLQNPKKYRVVQAFRPAVVENSEISARGCSDGFSPELSRRSCTRSATGRGGAPAGPPQMARQAAPIDLTGYWVSLIVDEWRFRVMPAKRRRPLSAAEQRTPVNWRTAWDPAKDQADGNACNGYGAVGVMQRPGRLRITWDGDPRAAGGSRRRHADADAALRPRAAQAGKASWQGYSVAEWQVNGRPLIDTGGTAICKSARVQGATRGRPQLGRPRRPT